METRHPGLYVQARGAIVEIAPLLADPSTLIVSGRRAWDSVRRGLAARDRMPGSGPRPEFVRRGDVEELSRLDEIRRRRGCRAVLAIGGGRAIDVGKACATESGLPCHVVPTVLGTDAACSSVSVLYDERGRFQRYVDRRSNPRRVVVDTEILREAPARYFAAGAVGALAVFFEADERIATGRCEGGPARAARYADTARKARDAFLALDPAGLGDPAGLPPGDLEELVFQALWTSAELFENVGLSLAHGVYRALRDLEPVARGGWLHGELVGLGLLGQLRLLDTHAAERERAREFVRVALDGTDWLGLARLLRDNGERFAESLGAWDVAGQATAPAEPRRVLAALVEILDRLAPDRPAQSTRI